MHYSVQQVFKLLQPLFSDLIFFNLWLKGYAKRCKIEVCRIILSEIDFCHLVTKRRDGKPVDGGRQGKAHDLCTKP